MQNIADNEVNLSKLLKWTVRSRFYPFGFSPVSPRGNIRAGFFFQSYLILGKHESPLFFAYMTIFFMFCKQK
jgi:hypothetical protein